MKKLIADIKSDPKPLLGTIIHLSLLWIPALFLGKWMTIAVFSVLMLCVNVIFREALLEFTELLRERDQENKS